MTFNKGDSIKKSSAKEGTSNSKLDFLKEDEDFEEVTNEEIEQFEVEEENEDYEDFEEVTSEEIEQLDINENIQKQESKVFKNEITILPRKEIKKIDISDNSKLKSVSKQANKLLKEFASDISDEEINKFLNLDGNHKEQMINGPLQFMNKNFSDSEKREMINKIENIKSSDIISKTNAAFVLKWLKKRSQ
ncbi:MAG: hypothetical protein KatS3mg068_1077 [Candidatus Sericytochromatia bacterium]|nr:MAG: hypothetical protein KatS3mg068_1077 [Candidatus Sericytochromatia bacterium]